MCLTMVPYFDRFFRDSRMFPTCWRTQSVCRPRSRTWHRLIDGSVKTNQILICEPISATVLYHIWEHFIAQPWHQNTNLCLWSALPQGCLGEGCPEKCAQIWYHVTSTTLVKTQCLDDMLPKTFANCIKNCCWLFFQRMHYYMLPLNYCQLSIGTWGWCLVKH